ncbi:hypothetical protein [Symbiobacterium thermophilum]|uniref:Uncharacterized protein n=1 Tax=Symbiobacterium thermophilum (strain DSM 24528 / JCM 14929 / IAM 14863 / T) TaxID=292459 RepID=Q67RR9_SYMTH|nr:hypothetical protein [Symbiobacterium thermophilum]BAD39624.1 hypothetical protein STH639 [Symbiobacterium thermophilum IAM 14863]
MGTRQRRPGTGTRRLRRGRPWMRGRGRRRTGWLAALVGRLRRRWRSFWHWEVLHALRERYPQLSRTRTLSPGELRRFPQRTWP